MTQLEVRRWLKEQEMHEIAREGATVMHYALAVGDARGAVCTWAMEPKVYYYHVTPIQADVSCKECLELIHS